MKQLLKDLIPQHVYRLIEEREYNLGQLSPGAADVLGPGTLNIPPSAIVDVKILKAPKPIFKCILDNGQSFNLIDNGEKLMQKGSIKKDDEEAETDMSAAEPDTPSEEPAAEPEA